MSPTFRGLTWHQCLWYVVVRVSMLLYITCNGVGESGKLSWADCTRRAFYCKKKGNCGSCEGFLKTWKRNKVYGQNPRSKVSVPETHSIYLMSLRIFIWGEIMVVFCDHLSLSTVFTANDTLNAFKICENIYTCGDCFYFFPPWVV